MNYSIISKFKRKYGLEKVTLFYKYSSNYYQRLFTVENYSGDLSLLKTDTLLSNAERIYPVEINSIIPSEGNGLTNDSFINYQWGLFNNDISLLQDLDDINSNLINGVSGNDIQISSIINDNYSGEELIIAVLDSGVDLDHPDLKKNIYKNIVECDSNGHFRYRPKEDIDNNGHVGDCMGWDFTAKNGTHTTYDDKGHGTHISGIIAASANDIGVRGVAPFVKILPVKIIKKRENTSGTSSFTDRVAKGILYAVKMKAKVINLSLGWPKVLDTKYVREAIREASRNGITIVAAAGNNNSNQAIYPCAYSEVICVGATTINGSIARFSNYGGHVDLLAPGEQILSTYPSKLVPSYFSVNGYEVKNGTSQAAPFVSGAVAIIKNKFPNITERSLKMKLLKSALPPLSQGSSMVGLLQVKKSLEANDDLFVIPDFKNLSNIKVKSTNNKFEFTLTLQNLSTKKGKVKYSIASKSSFISFTSGHSGLMEINDKLKIKVMGVTSNLDRNSNIDLQVNLNVNNKSIKFNHNLRLILDINDRSDSIYPIITTPIKNKAIAKVINGKIYPKMKT
ncbi:MAG: S8 family serine peptidase, partial [Bdellovibrionales bacterium]|nr:S8 family serine peptidase [Bdellovibrionales bacterium]